MKPFFLLAFTFALGFSPVHAQQAPTAFSIMVNIDPGDILNVRSGPGQSYPTVARLSNGTAGIHVQGKPVMNGSDDWVHITLGETEGWTRPKYLTITRVAINRATPATQVATEDESPAPTPSASNGNDTIIKAAVVVGGAYLLYKLFASDSSSPSSSSADEDNTRQQQQRDYAIQAQYDREEKARQQARDADEEARRQEARANAPITHVYGQ